MIMYLPNISELAIFADFDGTLVDIAPTPDKIQVDADLKNLLQQLKKRTDNAFAVVTGRSLEDIYRYLGDCDLTFAANHGGQWQLPGKPPESLLVGTEELTDYKKAISRFAHQHNLLFEEKSLGIAVHFRQQPAMEVKIDEFIEKLQINPTYKVIRGKAVREIKPTMANKGVAIERFMAMTPFAGKIPLFVGDDVTDEDGFNTVNAIGGITFKVGEGPSLAQNRLQNPADVRNLFTQLVSTFA